MNQERFDELTRALATGRLSRRQVLKTFAAGVLLAGPLASLFPKVGVAQTLGCVSKKCVKRAKKEYKACNRDCRRVTNSAECLEQCQASYAGELGICGCVTVNTDTVTGDVAYAPCEDPCTPQTLSEQAHQDAHYSKLADFLTAIGFVADVGPSPVVIQEDGQLVRSVLVRTYTHPTRTNESATLSYDVKASGETLAFAVVQDKQNGTVPYLLVVDEAGQVQKLDPPEDPQQTTEAPQQTSGPSTVSRAIILSTPGSKSCNSAQLQKCFRDVGQEYLICSRVARSPLALLACAGLLSAQLLDCIIDEGCGPVSSSFCTNDVCCPPGDTGCGGTPGAVGVCCNDCERCVNGSCVRRCKPGDICCDGPLNEVCCSAACEECDIGLGFTVACRPVPDAKTCGEACCGSCQVCEDPATSKCRNCNQCETCPDGVCVKVGDPCGSVCCDPGQQCCGGNCYPSTWTCCDGVGGKFGADLTSDPSNCGTCGNNCHFKCNGNKCCDGRCGYSATTCAEFLPCPPGQV
jgi:hypothetical protein